MFFAPQSIINFINISVEVQTVRDKLSVLKEYFGHDSFREGQDRITDSLLGGRDVLGIMPTGAGKSICYQVPALMFDGITIVVSPLISLMKDQVSARSAPNRSSMAKKKPRKVSPAAVVSTTGTLNISP